MKTEFIVAHFVPRDVHRHSHAAGAVVLLAAALDWDIVEKTNRPIVLKRDDVVIEIPDHTNLRFNVFRSWIRKLATHAPEFVLPVEVVEQIAHATKLSPDHKRILMDLAEQSLVPDSTPDEVVVAAEPTIISRAPYMAHLAGQQTYQSSASYERIWSDGHKDYECQICGRAFATPKGVGGHRQVHIRAGEAESDWQDRVRNAVRGVDPDYEPQRYGPRGPYGPRDEPEVSEPSTIALPEPAPEHELVEDESESLSNDTIVELIVDLVAPAWRRRALQAELMVEQLSSELADRNLEITRLRDNWEALKALIS